MIDWIERLGRLPVRVPLGTGGVIETRSWAYSPHLVDNVPHRHTYFEVCLVGAYGTGIFRVEDRAHLLRPGDLFIARPGVLHQIINTSRPLMELYWVCFHGNVETLEDKPVRELEALWRDFADLRGPLVVPDTDGRVYSLWNALRLAGNLAARQDERGDEAQLTALVSALLIAILQAGSGDRAALPAPPPARDGDNRAIHRAMRFIHDNLHRPLTVEQVAAEAGLSARQLTRLFLRFSGVAPAAYMAQARMDRAAILLLRTDDPIKQIAALLGYEDVPHFSRVFARLFGCPPGKFRRQGGGRPRVANADNIGGLV